MFDLDPSEYCNIRQSLVFAYQEQQQDQSVIFRCSDGEHRCSEIVLQFMSDYYTHQLAGRERLKNEAVFTYPYSKLCVKTFVDMMHGIKAESIDLITVLEMIKFLKFENKDSSQFENAILKLLIKKIIDANLPLDTRMLVCMICNSYDNFKHDMEEPLFKDHTATELTDKLLKLDLRSEQNQPLRNIITKELDDNEDLDEDIQGLLFSMIAKMKKRKVVMLGDHVYPSQEPGDFLIHFHSSGTGVKHYSLEIGKRSTVAQVIEQLQEKRTGKRIEGDTIIEEVGVRDGDRVDF